MWNFSSVRCSVSARKWGIHMQRRPMLIQRGKTGANKQVLHRCAVNKIQEVQREIEKQSVVLGRRKNIRSYASGLVWDHRDLALSKFAQRPQCNSHYWRKRAWLHCHLQLGQKGIVFFYCVSIQMADLPLKLTVKKEISLVYPHFINL